jgi:DNA-binding LacI/PurR family transcriptional regulator
MREAGLAPEWIDAPENTRQYGYRVLTDHIERHGVPHALFCENDELAVGGYRALSERGLRISQDIAVIGCDDTDEGRFLSPALTTISQPIEALCRHGWAFLKCRMEDRTLERQQLRLLATLTRRESH